MGTESGLVFECSLSGGKASDGQAEGRAGYVGESYPMTELNGIGVAPVFAADAEFNVLASGATKFDCHFHEFADAELVEDSERILADDFLLLIAGKEGTGVVAAHAKGGLGKVICAEAKELG